MSEKNIKSRIINKHDVEENWLKATTFVPKKGELIVYDIDNNYTYERFKIGDGATVVSSLPFATDNIGAVLYGAVQTLTQNQKSQAKMNIGIYVSDTEPTDMAIGDFWLDTSYTAVQNVEEVSF